MSHYDLIVMGLGGVGSAAAWQAARRGARVLALDRFPPGHDRGSSHGQTRIIRQAYFEHPDYVPLVLRAYALWHELERDEGERLLHPVGLLQVGPPAGEVVPGVLASAQRHGLRVDTWDDVELARRFPALAIPPGMVGAFESAAGYLLVERCVLAMVRQAERLGATLRVGETVVGWRPDGKGLRVETDRGAYTAAAAVLAPGAWAGPLLADQRLNLRVLRKHLHWFPAPEASYSERSGFPAFLFELPEGVFYGFPRIDGRGLKVAEHSGGEVVDDPLAVSRAVDPADQARVARFVAAHVPGASPRGVDHAVCLYTMSPDGHFIVDRHPEQGRLAYVAGLSGHGFKFVPALGQAAVELALDGGTSLPVEFLRRSRLP